MGFLAKAFKKITPKKRSQKQNVENSAEVTSDGDEEGSILSVALEEQISQILDVEEENESVTEDEYNQQNSVYSDGDHIKRRAKNQKGAKTRKTGGKNRREEDISIAMSGFSLVFW